MVRIKYIGEKQQTFMQNITIYDIDMLKFLTTNLSEYLNNKMTCYLKLPYEKIKTFEETKITENKLVYKTQNQNISTTLCAILYKNKVKNTYKFILQIKISLIKTNYLCASNTIESREFHDSELFHSRIIKKFETFWNDCYNIDSIINGIINENIPNRKAAEIANKSIEALIKKYLAGIDYKLIENPFSITIKFKNHIQKPLTISYVDYLKNPIKFINNLEEIQNKY